ncbi:hypothetical protein DY000_02031240 [Brassica cretica]|uniref:Uncharacterized protein n=1 Tax=Brassica cretica TaxID=69181 RepID=A0ABQ7DNP2_BRACR|nr:hypothetical protein DY000_02031240 [Brassica cretica]
METLLKDGGSRMLPSSSVCLANNLCTSGDLIIQRELAVQRTRVSARWELMKEWLEKKVGHWNPEEEYRQYLLVIGEGGQFGGFPLVSPPAPEDASSS